MTRWCVLLLVVTVLASAAGADHAAVAVEVNALVEHGYRQARDDGAGEVPPLPTLTAAVGKEAVDALVAAIARPDAAGVGAWEALAEHFDGWIVNAKRVGRGAHRAVLSVMIVDSPKPGHLATARLGKMEMPVRIAGIITRHFRERPRDRGMVIDLRAPAAYVAAAEFAEEERRARVSRTAPIDADAMLAQVAKGKFRFLDALFANTAIIGKRRWQEAPAEADAGALTASAKAQTIWAFEISRRNSFLEHLAYGRTPDGVRAEEYLEALGRIWAVSEGSDEFAAMAEFLAVPSQGLAGAPEHVDIVKRLLARLLDGESAGRLGLRPDGGAREALLALPHISREDLRDLAARTLLATIEGDTVDLAATRMKAGDDADAADLLANCVMRFPRAFHSVRALAMALVKLGELRDARVALEEALARDPAPTAKAELLNTMAIVVRVGGDHQLADDFVRRAWAAEPGHELVLVSLAEIELRAGRTDEATRLAQKLIGSSSPEIRRMGQQMLDQLPATVPP